MTIAYNYTDQVLNALKFYSIGVNDNGAAAKAALPLAQQVTEQFGNAVTIINNLMEQEIVLKRQVIESNARRCSERRAADEELTRLRKILTKNKISYKKPVGKK